MSLKLAVAIAAAIIAAPASAITVGSNDSGNCYPFNCNDSGTSVGQSIRYMQIYSASAFSGITKFSLISFFPFADAGAAAVINGSYNISFHTTTASIGDAFPFAPLANSALFFNGNPSTPLSFSPFRRINGPTYTYNPADGNLVLDIIVTNQDNLPNGSGNGYFQADYTGVATTRAYSLTGTGERNGTGALVTVFGTIPEPENWALLIAGFGITGLAMRRRIKTVAA